MKNVRHLPAQGPTPAQAQVTEYMPPGAIKRVPERLALVRRHTNAEQASINASVMLHGVVDPIVVDQDNRLVKGNGKLTGAEYAHLGLVPITKRHFSSETEVARFILSMVAAHRRIAGVHAHQLYINNKPYYDQIAEEIRRKEAAEPVSRDRPDRKARDTRDIVAELLGLGTGRSLSRYDALRDHSIELYEEIVASKVSLRDAERRVKESRKPGSGKNGKPKPDPTSPAVNLSKVDLNKESDDRIWLLGFLYHFGCDLSDQAKVLNSKTIVCSTEEETAALLSALNEATLDLFDSACRVQVIRDALEVSDTRTRFELLSRSFKTCRESQSEDKVYSRMEKAKSLKPPQGRRRFTDDQIRYMAEVHAARRR